MARDRSIETLRCRVPRIGQQSRLGTFAAEIRFLVRLSPSLFFLPRALPKLIKLSDPHPRQKKVPRFDGDARSIDLGDPPQHCRSTGGCGTTAAAPRSGALGRGAPEQLGTAATIEARIGSEVTGRVEGIRVAHCEFWFLSHSLPFLPLHPS